MVEAQLYEGLTRRMFPGSWVKTNQPELLVSGMCSVWIPPVPSKVQCEVIVNGDVKDTETLLRPGDTATAGKLSGEYFKKTFKAWFSESGWLAVRCFQTLPDGRVLFAHTAPWWVEIEGKPLRPRREQADWFVQRTEEEIARNTGILSAEQLAEFHEALAAWKKIQATAR